MTPLEAIQKIEAQRKKGWSFEIHADSEGWHVQTVGNGLATGRGSGPMLEAALEIALDQALAMVDDPDILLLRYGDPIKKVAGEVFGKDVEIDDFELLNDSDYGPLRIGLHVKPKVKPEVYVDLELKFFNRLEMEFPKEAYTSFTVTEEWPGDK